MIGLGPILAQVARWQALPGPWDVAAIAVSLAFAAASSLAVAGRRR